MSNVIQAPPSGNANTQNPSFSFPKPVGFGNLLTIFFDWANTSGIVESIQDNLGNPWQIIASQQIIGTLRTLYCFATTVSNPGLCTVTVSTDQARNYFWSIYEAQYATLTLDGQPIFNTSTSVASSASTGPLTTAFPNSVVFVHTHAGPILTSPAAPWVSEVNNQHGTAYQIGITPGTFNATWTFTSSNWATLIIAFQSTGQEPQAPPMGPVPLISCLCQPNVLADPNALSNPNVSCISARTHWANMQPHRPSGGLPTNNPNDPSYNWTFIDSVFAQALQFGKYVWLRIVVQEFDIPGWAQSQIQPYVDCSGVTRFIWWDPNYQALMTAMIQAVAARYGSNPLFKLFACNFAAAGAGDWDMPHVPPSTNPIGASNWSTAVDWQCPPYNQTVTVTPVAGQPVYPGWVVWVQGFGWFQVQSITGTTAAPMSVTLVNLGYSGNASSGTVSSANIVMQVSDIANLTSPMYNYTTDKVVAALENIISVAIAALPSNVVYSHEVGRNNRLDPQPNSGVTWSYNCATRMAQRGYAVSPPGRWAIAKNGWSAARSQPQIAMGNQDNDVMYLLAQTVYGSTNTSGTIGSIPKGGLQCGQWTWNVIDPSGQYLPTTTGGQTAYQVNGGVPYGPADCQSVFNRAMDIIRYYGMYVIETYQVDIVGGLLDNYLGYVPPTPIRPNPQPPSGLIVPPYSGQTQVSSIGVAPPFPSPEDGPGCCVYLPPPLPEAGTDVVPPPVYMTDIFSAQQTWPL